MLAVAHKNRGKVSNATGSRRRCDAVAPRRYKIDDEGKVTLPGINTKGDCFHDNFLKQDTTFYGMTYNNATDIMAIELAVSGRMIQTQLTK